MQQINEETTEKEKTKREREQKIKILKDYIYLEESIKKLEEEYKDISRRISYDDNTSSVKELIDKKKELLLLCKNELIKRYTIKNKIYKVIYELDDERERKIILNKYFENMTYDKIAEKMHYSDRQIMRLHNKAIDKINFVN